MSLDQEVVVHCTIDPTHVDANYDHLNNAWYHIYYEQGRLALQRERRLDDETLIGMDVGLFVTSYLQVRYHKQVKPHQSVAVHSRFGDYEEINDKGVFYIYQRMVVEGVDVAERTIELMLVDLVELRRGSIFALGSPLLKRVRPKILEKIGIIPPSEDS